MTAPTMSPRWALVNHWVPIRHLHNLDGGTGCGGIALYAVRRHAPIDPVTPEQFRRLDGAQPRRDEPVACGACGMEWRVWIGAGWDFGRDVTDQAMERG